MKGEDNIIQEYRVHTSGIQFLVLSLEQSHIKSYKH